MTRPESPGERPTADSQDRALLLLRGVIRALGDDRDIAGALSKTLQALNEHFHPMSSYVLRASMVEQTWQIEALQQHLARGVPVPVGESLPLDQRMWDGLSQLPADHRVLHWHAESPPPNPEFWRDLFGIETLLASRLEVADSRAIWVLAMDRQANAGKWSGRDRMLFSDVALAVSQRLQTWLARQTLEREAHYWKALADAQPDLLFTAAADGGFDYVSPSWTEATGLAPGSCLGWGWMAALHAEDLATCAQTWQAAVVAGKDWQATVRMRPIGSQGPWQVFHLRAAPQTDADRKQTKWLGSGRRTDGQRPPRRASSGPLLATAADRAGMANPRILLVDDVDDNRALIKAFLRKTAFVLEEANCGQDAVQMCADRQYDCIIMDVQMPDMTGLAATQAIRRQELALNRHSVPIVAITAHTLETDRAATVAAGCQAFLTKPIGQKELIGTLRGLIG